ncbi:MAG: DUF6525 family protein, partial [Paracoccus sp. (in: a-proteobacteria)]
PPLAARSRGRGLMSAVAHTPRCGNLGQTAQRMRRRSRDPMADFDALPAPLRRWLAQAALPWSPASCLRLWRRACARGLDLPDRLAALDRAEAKALIREVRMRAGVPD